VLKIIDRYIIKKFLGTFLYAIILVVLIAVIFDISEKLDDFLKRDAPMNAIFFDYYLNFIPYFVNLFSPLFIFIAVVFFTSRLAQQTEIIAIINSGVSFWRLMRPYFITAAMLAVFSFWLNNFILPHANRDRLEFENTYINGLKGFTERNIHRQTAPGESIYFQSFNNRDNRGYRFTLEKFQNSQLVFKLSAETCQWDSLKNKWTLKNYKEHKFNGMDEKIRVGRVMDTTININPAEFRRRVTNVQTLNYMELNDFIDQETKRGSGDIEFYKVEKYMRTSMPFASFILTLIGVALSSRKIRGGIGVNLAFGFVISFAYIMFMQVSSTFATNGSLHPMLAVWIPNITFSILAIYLAIKAPK
jgi:lipopolysaccharide export system permease protein